MDAPILHREFLEEVLPRIQQDPRVAGIAVAGSLAEGRADFFSDVDLVVVVDDAAFDAVMADRLVLISTYFKFIRVSDFAERTDDPDIVWDRDGDTLKVPSHPPRTAETLDLQWIEDRIWVWVHYGATKLGRGELFEVIGFLAYLREAVLGPLAARRAGARPRGVALLAAAGNAAPVRLDQVPPIAVQILEHDDRAMGLKTARASRTALCRSRGGATTTLRFPSGRGCPPQIRTHRPAAKPPATGRTPLLQP